VEDGKKWQQIPSVLRHYLRVGNPGHRKALTKLLVADHNYGDKASRWRSDVAACVDLMSRLPLMCGWG
jgi:hypothetical protein